MISLTFMWLMRWRRMPLIMALLAVPPAVLLATWISLRRRDGLVGDAELLGDGVALLLASLAYALGFWSVQEERRRGRTALLAAGPAGWSFPIAILLASQAALLCSAIGCLGVVGIEGALDRRWLPVSALVSAAARCQGAALFTACISLLVALGRSAWELGAAGFASSIACAAALLARESDRPVLAASWLAAIVCVSLWLVLAKRGAS